ncbi:hypothetical protein [Paraburkholderia phenoliruptrix]|uniref:hypothetical protein n=1 Tax=Paraburkholderia phenoliruptrix TaxID=252970 RepID=UPI0011D18D2E|nr:hypothetical protein [Paraburkholderia phenoliruptrix]
MKASSGFTQMLNLIGSYHFPAKQVSPRAAASDLVRTQHVMTTVVDSIRVWLDYANKSFVVDLQFAASAGGIYELLMETHRVFLRD